MSPGVIDYHRRMARWQPDAQGKLAEAALTLYAEQGYDATTVSEIAERAGLTKRTFFRHFADKREVLFAGAEALEALFVDEVAAAPASAAGLDAVAAALDAVAASFEERRPFAARRQQVILANPALLERELIKLATLAGAVAQALRGRGVPDPAAILTAEAGITVFRVSFERWVDPANTKTFQQVTRESLEGLRAVTAA
jgi:AcrR family transcriptional regulator